MSFLNSQDGRCNVGKPTADLPSSKVKEISDQNYVDVSFNSSVSEFDLKLTLDGGLMFAEYQIVNLMP